MKRMNPRWKSPPMWPSGVGSRQPCPRESALRRAAVSGNINALPPHHVPTGRSVRVFICANPDDTEAERNALKEHVYPKLRDFCRENYGIEFQVSGCLFALIYRMERFTLLPLPRLGCTVPGGAAAPHPRAAPCRGSCPFKRTEGQQR
ncbi:NACHT and WD repeat domain-containing protein 2-like [Salarias fasciatus]|uniref:NACHT and WD repeat domain-containing protein 2-like n=1 Tax=Salarias fasciatus TaxID=181472 RepID=UPI0011765D20|nr:NACHT and WD repeat domain-containing protein 2-like [Salarias fasciatus]